MHMVCQSRTIAKNCTIPPGGIMIYKLNKHIETLEQSSIRAISLRCGQLQGINLGQGICDNPVHPLIMQAACDAINNNKNTYVHMKGIPELREQVAIKAKKFNKIECDIENVLITHGATGAFVGAVKALFNPGDEIILFEPFYGYHKGLVELFGVNTKSIPLVPENFALDVEALRGAITEKTRAIIVCTPCNPCGKVFTKDELRAIGDLACEKDLFILTDEMYEYIIYPGHQHISIASLDKAYFNRTITISGFSKTYNITGWRMGYLIAPAELVDRIALANDFFYICPATPFQYACVAALQLPEEYYQKMQTDYLKKRDFFLSGLQEIGFSLVYPDGAYYVLADFSGLQLVESINPSMDLLEDTYVGAVDGRAFFTNPEKGKHLLRFCFASNSESLRQALQYLEKSELLRQR